MPRNISRLLAALRLLALTANSVTLDGTGDQAGEHFTYTRGAIG